METKEQQINNLKEYVVHRVLEADTESKRKDSVIRAWNAYNTEWRRAAHSTRPCGFCLGPPFKRKQVCMHQPENMPCFASHCTERKHRYACACNKRWNCAECIKHCAVCDAGVCLSDGDGGGGACGAQCESCDAVYCCNNNNKAKHENVCSVCNSDKCPVCDAHFCAPAKEKRKRERQDQ